MACRMAVCNAGAKRNPIPISRMAAPTRSGGTSSETPSASRTSAEPHFDEIERLPCLAMCTPAPAATNAAAVEMLNVPEESPPVPQVSTSNSSGRDPSAKTGVACRRIARAKPTNSPTVSPFARRTVSSATMVSSSERPERISPIAISASWRERSEPASIFLMSAFIICRRNSGHGGGPKVAGNAGPCCSELATAANSLGSFRLARFECSL